jgi:transposase
VKAARLAWPATVRDLAPKRLVFLDETWLSTAMARLFGYAPRGERLHDAVPYRHWKTVTFVAGLSADGLLAPRVYDGPMNAASFEGYLAKALAPQMRPGDLLVMDNLAAHKAACVRAALDRCGIARLYLPPYSPDLNPIENAFSKLKGLMRGAAERTVDGLKNAVRKLLRCFDSEECRNYIRHCGYTLR